MKPKFSPVALALGLISARAAVTGSVPALMAISISCMWPVNQAAAAPPIQTGGSMVLTGTGGIQDGQNGNGYFVQGGDLTISNLTLTNFASKGGSGSGGGAGMGGAVFVNTGATLILNNVNLLGNTAAGGAGNISLSSGGTLNNLFNGGPVGTAGANGYTPTQSSYTDIGGTTGTKGYNGTFNVSGFGGAGGIGGAGGDGGDRSVSLILGTTNASLALVAWVSQLVADSANPFTANVAVGLALSVAQAGIGLGDAIAANVYFDKSLADGQIGLGGSGGVGGIGGQGAFGYGGGVGGAGGAGGVGGANWSGSAYHGGAAGGDAGDGGTGGVGGFGAGGGQGGTGGLGGAGAGVAGNGYIAAVADVMGTKIIPAIYAQQYTDPVTHLVVTVAGKDNLSSPSGEFTQSMIVSDGSTRVVTISTVKTFAEQTVSYIITPGSAAIEASAPVPGGRPDGLGGAGGDGGSGGFGAGQGAGGTGNTTLAAGGSGGDGMGGGLFVRAGGIVTIQGNTNIGQNIVRGGAGQIGTTAVAAGSAGGAVGSDIFMMTGSVVTLNPGAGNVIKITGSIADDSAASITSAIPSGSGANLTITSGLVVLNGTNTYSGETRITGGVLQAQDGTGIFSDSHINFSGGVLQSNGDFIRLVGADPSKVEWTGSGGFAAVGGVLNVSLNDSFGQAAATQTWNNGGFVPTGSSLLFGSLSATDNVNFRNNIDLNGGNRSILVQANSAMAVTGASAAIAANVDTATLTGVLSSGSLTVGDGSHTGILIFTNSNTYAGGTTINGGTLALARSFKADGTTLISTGSLNPNGIVTIAGGADLDISQTGNQAIGDLAGAGTVNLGAFTLTINQAAASTFSGVLADGGLGGGSGAGIIKNGAGVLTLSGASTYTGTTEISVGGIVLNGTLASPTIHLTGGTTLTLGAAERLLDSVDLTIDSLATVTLGGNEKIGSLAGAGSLQNAGGRLTLDDGNFSGVISGTGGLTKVSAGNLILSGANTYSGSTLIDVGTLTLDGSLAGNVINVASGAILINSAGGLSATATLTNAGTVEQNADDTIHALVNTGTINNSAHTLTAATYALNNGSVINANLGSGTVTANDTVALNGTSAAEFFNVITGTTTLGSAERLLNTTDLTIDSLAILKLGGNEKIGSLFGAGSLQNAGFRLTLDDGNFSGVISGAGGLTKVSGGNLILSGANTYDDSTLIDAGTLTLDGSLTGNLIHVASGAILTNNASGLSATATLTNDGTVNQNSDDTIAALVNTGTINNSAHTLTALTYALNGGSVIHANLGGGSVTSNGAVALNGTSAAEIFRVQTGTTTLGSAERLLDTTALTLDAGANLQLGGNEKIGSLWGAGNLVNAGGRLTLDHGSFSGVISGTGGLTKVTGGELILSGANTDIGFSLITAGSLTLDGSLESNLVNVSAGASLAVNAAGLSATADFINNGSASLAVSDTVWRYEGSGTLNGPGQLNAASPPGTLGTPGYTLNRGSVINANLGTGDLVTNGNVLLNGVSQSRDVKINTGSILTLGGAQRLDALAKVTVNGSLVLAGGNQVIYDLLGHGDVHANSYSFTVSNGGGFFTGSINAASTPLVSDGGVLKLDGGTTTTPSTEINNGSNLIIQNGGQLVSNLITVSSVSTLTVDLTGILDYDTLTGNGMVNPLSGTFTNPTDSLVRGFLTFQGNYTNRGTLAPGNSPGLITIAGNYTEAGTLQTELESTTPVTGYDQVRVGGSVTLLSSSTLVVQTYNNVPPARGSIYQVIASSTGGTKSATGNFGAVRFDADGALGAGASVVNAAAIFDQATGRVIATGLNDAGSTFAGLGASNNQRRAAGALFDSATSAVGPNQINAATVAGALALQLVTANGGSSSNLARFTPEFYGAIADYAMGNDLTITNLLHDRVASTRNLPGVTPPEQFALYSGVMRQQIDTADQADLDRTDAYIGGDYAISKDTTVGLLVNYNTGDFSAAYGRGDVDGIETDAYFKQSLNRGFDLVGRLGYGSYNNDLRRTTTDIVQAFGETDSSVFSGSLGVSYRGWTWGEVSVAPRADLTYSHASVDGFTETGANDRLTLGAYDADHLLAQVGGSLVWATKLAGRNFSVELNVGIVQSLLDNQDDQHATVVTAPNVGFYQTFADDDLTSAAYGLNIGYSVCDRASIYAGYEGRASSNSSGNANAGLRVSF